MLLIISNKWDVSVDFVVRECQKNNLPYIRLNSEDLVNNEVAISTDDSIHVTLRKNGVDYILNNCVTSIWVRRPGKVYEFMDGEKPSDAIQKFVHEQWAIWLEALEQLENVLWVNNPYTSSKMENKIVQLNIARNIGFTVPNTLITNSARKVKKHFGSTTAIITKALYSPLLQEPEQDYFIFTNTIKVDQLVESEVSICPSIYQECLWPKKDYRVTVVENKVLTAEIIIESDQQSDIDWRKLESQAVYRRVKLPPEIQKMCIDFVKKCGLIFGAIDLVEHDGTYYFIEINPSGEWGWLQKQLKLPVAEALVYAFKRRMQTN